MRQETKAVGGYFTVGGKTFYSKAKFERRWACVLELCKRYPELSQAVLGFEITDWAYEAKTFFFDDPDFDNPKKRGVMVYKPDFFLYKKDGSMMLHETKGWLDRASKTKLRCLRKYYPQQKLAIVVDGLPKGQTASSRIKLAELRQFSNKLGYPLIDAKPIFKSLNGGFDKQGVDL